MNKITHFLTKGFIFLFIISCNNAMGQCTGITISNPSSLIPNTSFEDRTCCPDDVTGNGQQMDCILDHIQASEATIDYHVVDCGSSLDHPCIPFVPTETSPENGILGLVNSNGWKEYLGTCLTGPLNQGIEYTLQFKIGFGQSKGPCEIQGITYEYESSSPVSFALFGASSCTALPFSGSGCPGSGWTLLGTATLSGNDEWVLDDISFTAPGTINAIVFGPDCSAVSGVNGYYFLDDFILSETAVLNPQLDIESSGHPCSGLTLTTTYHQGLSYQWYKNDNPIPGATSTIYQIPVGMEGEYFVRMYQGNQCVESDHFIYQIPAYETFLDQEICFDETLQVGNNVFDQSGEYEVSLTTNEGCDSTVYLSLIVREALVIEHFEDGEILCAGGTISVEVTSNADIPSFHWNDGAVGQVRDLPAGDYEVFVTDALGCSSDSYSFSLTEPDSLNIHFEITNESCVGYEDGTALPLISGGVAPYLIKFEGDSTFHDYQEGLKYLDLFPGEYSMIVQDSNGCTLQKSFTILPREPVDVFINAVETIAIGDSTLLSIETNPEIQIDSFFWQGNQLNCNSCSTPTIYPLSPPSNLYLVQIIEETVGCVYDASTAIKVLDGIYIPNIFSPDNSGLNDFFFIQSNANSVVLIEELLIFNRWNELVFNQRSFPPNDKSYGWDGQLRNKQLPSDNYIYAAKIRLVNGQTITKKGTVMLIR